MIKFVFKSSLLGLLIPLLLQSILIISEKMFRSLSLSIIIDRIKLLVWPSSIWTMLGSTGVEKRDIEILAISIFVNIVFYTILGFFVWLGLNKYRWILYVLPILILFGWWKLIHL